MNSELRRRLVHRFDAALLVVLIVSIGTATVLFWLVGLRNLDEEEQAAEAPSATATQTATARPTATATVTESSTPTATFTASPTLTPYPTPQVEPLAAVGLYAGQPFVLSGDAQPGDAVIILNQGTPLAQGVAAASNGAWAITFDAGLPAGSYALAVMAANDAGGRSEAVPVSILVQSRPTDTPTLTATPTLTSTPTATNSPTATPTATLTSSPTTTHTPLPSPTNTLTGTPSITATATMPTATSSPTVTATATQTSTATSTVTPTASATPSATHTEVAEVIVASATPTATHTATPSLTVTPTGSPTLTAMPTPTVTPSLTPTLTVTTTPTPTLTATALPSATATASPSDTVTATLTITASFTATPTATTSATATLTATPTLTASATLTATSTSTPTVTATATPAPSVTPTASPTTSPTADLVAPTILSPGNGATVVAGRVPISGRGAANVEIELVSPSGQILATTTTNAAGRWSVDLNLEVADTVTVIAQVADRSDLQSDPVVFTVAPVVQPRTGVALTPEPQNERGAAYTALIALVITALGLALIYAGRMLYSLAHRSDEDE